MNRIPRLDGHSPRFHSKFIFFHGRFVRFSQSPNRQKAIVLYERKLQLPVVVVFTSSVFSHCALLQNVVEFVSDVLILVVVVDSRVGGYQAVLRPDVHAVVNLPVDVTHL